VSKVFGVPLDCDRGEQVEPCRAVVLSFGRSVSDFPLTTSAQSILQRVVRLTLVEANLGTARHVGIEQSFNDEQRPFDPSDFVKGKCLFVLTGIRSELLQQLARWHDACGHRGDGAQNSPHSPALPKPMTSTPMSRGVSR
jgi:hypothetical protein